MTKAIQEGMPKLRIEKCAAERQARVDRGDDTIVGVNKYTLDEQEELDVLDIDNQAVRKAQIARLEGIRATRDTAKCEAALAELSRLAETGEGNLLEAAIVHYAEPYAVVAAPLDELGTAIEFVLRRSEDA